MIERLVEELGVKKLLNRLFIEENIDYLLNRLKTYKQPVTEKDIFWMKAGIIIHDDDELISIIKKHALCDKLIFELDAVELFPVLFALFGDNLCIENDKRIIVRNIETVPTNLRSNISKFRFLMASGGDNNDNDNKSNNDEYTFDTINEFRIPLIHITNYLFVEPLNGE